MCVLFPWGKHGSGLARLGATRETLDDEGCHAGCERRAARTHVEHGGADGTRFRFLQQVTLRASPQGVEHELGGIQSREHQTARARGSTLEALDDLDTGTVRQPEVHESYILARHPKLRVGVEAAHEACADDLLIFDHDNPNHAPDPSAPSPGAAALLPGLVSRRRGPNDVQLARNWSHYSSVSMNLHKGRCGVLELHHRGVCSMRTVAKYSGMTGLLLLGACARLAPEGVSTNEAGTQPAPQQSASAVVSDAGVAAEAEQVTFDDWRAAVRLEQWSVAKQLLDALPQKERDDPGVRYVRARVAIALGDHADAVKLLKGLEAQLPVLRDEIARDRAESQLVAGPYEPAARYFAQQGRVPQLIKAAEAFEKAKLSKQAMAAIEHAISRAARLRKQKRLKSPDLEAQARVVRARLLDAAEKPKAAAADRSWVLTNAPTSAAARTLQAPQVEQKLTKAQRYERAMEMARDGDVTGVDAELEKLAQAPGPGLAAAELVHARGWAHYMQRSYAKAADLLQQAAIEGTKHRVRDHYYAAKARSRAHDDHKAIEMYEQLAKRFPSSGFAERAHYAAARLRYILGDWKGADDAYGRYLKRYGKKGKFIDSVRYERAVARLAAGKHESAAKVLGKLARVEKNARDKSRLLQLSGVALQKAGKQDAAAEVYRQVMKERPLSFAALAARSRLTEMGLSAPPIIAPPKVESAPAPLEVKLPNKVQVLMGLGLDADAEAELASHESRIRKTYGKRGDEALCKAYGRLAHAGRRYRVGQRAASWQELAVAPSERTRWTWDCIYPRPYADVVRAAEKRHELPSNLVYALMRQESGFRPSVVSPAKAVGLMQMIPPTARNVAKELNVEYEPMLMHSPAYNIRFGSYYLRKVLDTFGGNMALALAAYNAGPSAVSRWLESGENLPLDVFVARIPYGETRGYVGRVLGNLARYAYLEGGESAVPLLDLKLPKGARAGQDAY